MSFNCFSSFWQWDPSSYYIVLSLDSHLRLWSPRCSIEARRRGHFPRLYFRPGVSHIKANQALQPISIERLERSYLPGIWSASGRHLVGVLRARKSFDSSDTFGDFLSNFACSTWFLIGSINLTPADIFIERLVEINEITGHAVSSFVAAKIKVPLTLTPGSNLCE